MCGFHDTVVDFRVVPIRRAPVPFLSLLGTLGRLNDTKRVILQADVESAVLAHRCVAPSGRSLMQCVGSM
jgi:hypothetical protein